jgi:outer membrane protein assembly factor BamB
VLPADLRQPGGAPLVSIANGVAYVTTGRGLLALKVADGTVLADLPTADGGVLGPAAATDGRVFAVDSASGALLAYGVP